RRTRQGPDTAWCPAPAGVVPVPLLLAAATATAALLGLAALGTRHAVRGTGPRAVLVAGEVALDHTALAVHRGSGEVEPVRPLRGLQALGEDLRGSGGALLLQRGALGAVLHRNLLDLLLDLDLQVEQVADGLL